MLFLLRCVRMSPVPMKVLASSFDQWPFTVLQQNNSQISDPWGVGLYFPNLPPAKKWCFEFLFVMSMGQISC